MPARQHLRTLPEIYGPWSVMSQAMMNGPSPLSQGERELILAFAAGLGGCRFVFMAHAEVAYAWGIERGLLDRLLDDFDTAPLEPRLRPLLAYLRKLVLEPAGLSDADAEAVLAGGWDEQALHDAIAIAARAAFMQRLVEGFGFNPLPSEVAAKHAKRRVELGYVNLYTAFRKPG
jgi:alkylhydroperoxidase family enzyme